MSVSSLAFPPFYFAESITHNGAQEGLEGHSRSGIVATPTQDVVFKLLVVLDDEGPTSLLPTHYVFEYSFFGILQESEQLPRKIVVRAQVIWQAVGNNFWFQPFHTVFPASIIEETF